MDAPDQRPSGSQGSLMALTELDRLELLHVQHLYGHVVDAFLWDKLDEVFAPDAVFDASEMGVPVMRGLEEMREKFIPMEEGPDRNLVHSHLCTNAAIMQVRQDGVVEVRSKYIVSSDHGWLSFGEYSDECVKTDHGWRIRQRRAHRFSVHRLEPRTDG